MRFTNWLKKRTLADNKHLAKAVEKLSKYDAPKRPKMDIMHRLRQLEREYNRENVNEGFESTQSNIQSVFKNSISDVDDRLIKMDIDIAKLRNVLLLKKKDYDETQGRGLLKQILADQIEMELKNYDRLKYNKKQLQAYKNRLWLKYKKL
jgi:hypothetical protein